MTTKTNTAFFTDQVDLAEIDGNLFASVLNGFTSPIGWYISRVEEHLASVKKVASENVLVRDLRVSWGQPTTKELKVKVVGTVPWSNERVAEFEAAMKTEKSEIDQLRLLVGKYPGKAADALGYMLETQKAKDTVVRPTAEFESVE
jgi:hypothetical protein